LICFVIFFIATVYLHQSVWLTCGFSLFIVFHSLYYIIVSDICLITAYCIYVFALHFT